MYNTFKKMNSNGFTLIEIIASIAILGMVIAVLLPIFPQIMGWTKISNDELVASNLLEKVANDVKDEDLNGIREFIKTCRENNENIEWESIKDYATYKLNDTIYIVDLKVCKESEIDLYRTNIQIFTQDDKLVSESYTYINPGDQNEES